MCSDRVNDAQDKCRPNRGRQGSALPTTRRAREAARLGSPKPRACNDRELLFLAEYMKDWNGTQAMLRAGITTKPSVAKVYASEWLLRPHVIAELSGRRQLLMEKHDLTLDRLLEELRRVGFANISDLIQWDANGLTLRPSSTLPECQLAAVAEISEISSKGKTKLAVKMHPKLDALCQLLKHVSPPTKRGPAAETEKVATIIIEGGATGLEVTVDSA
jgi:phage terminase small subunit